MANDCSFDMRVYGKKENIEKFFEWLTADYDFSSEDGINCWHRAADGTKIPCEHHIGYRIFESYVEEIVECGNSSMGPEYGTWMGYAYGSCAWSVYSCMFSGPTTYFNDFKERNDKAISIVDATRALNVDVEIFTAEPGIGFSEHYIVTNGQIVTEDEVEYHEYEDEDGWYQSECEFRDKDGWKWEL